MNDARTTRKTDAIVAQYIYELSGRSDGSTRAGAWFGYPPQECRVAVFPRAPGRATLSV